MDLLVHAIAPHAFGVRGPRIVKIISCDFYPSFIVFTFVSQSQALLYPRVFGRVRAFQEDPASVAFCSTALSLSLGLHHQELLSLGR
jgi:hypothetical protein